MTEAARAHPAVVVPLDLGLPDLDGVEVPAGISAAWSAGPGDRALRALHPSAEKVAALDAGCRRLRHQAVRNGRTAGPDYARRSGAPAADLAGETVQTPGVPDRPGGQAGAARRRRGPSHPDRVGPASQALVTQTPDGSSPRRQLLHEVWGPAVRRGDQLPARVHGATSAASSNPTPRGPATSSPNPAWAIAS